MFSISFDILSQLISFVNNFFSIFLNSFRSSCRAFMPQRLFIITHCFQLVKHFFELFSKLSCFSIAATVIDFIRTVRFCQALFFFFFEEVFCSASPAVRCILSSHARFCQYLFCCFFTKFLPCSTAQLVLERKKRNPKSRILFSLAELTEKRGI